MAQTTTDQWYENLAAGAIKLLSKVSNKPKSGSTSTTPQGSKKSGMSTFNLPNTNVPVTLVRDLTEQQLLDFPAFKNWLATLQKNLALQHTDVSHEFHNSPFELRSITIQAIDRFGPASSANRPLGFIKLQTLVSNSNNDTLSGSVFLRGASVGMMVVLQPDDLPKDSTEEKYVILTVQPRIPAGALQFVELPAGMVDKGTFKGTAAKEIEEELSMTIPADELVDLTQLAISDMKVGRGEEVPQGMFPSSGGCDEFIPIFLHEKRVRREDLMTWEGKLTGLREEGERITLKMVKLEDLWKEGARDAKALGAWALYEGLKRNGKL